LKKILLLSDTHGFLDPAVIKYAEQADEIWHAGDVGPYATLAPLFALKPVKAVYGNIDGTEVRISCPENLIFQVDQVKVLMTHIAGYPGKFSARVKSLIAEHRPQLLISGHSHILKVMYDKANSLLYMNPGAAGNHGFHQIKTLLRFEITGADIQKLEVIELGKRSSS
jgi:uncharacterized protein